MTGALKGKVGKKPLPSEVAESALVAVTPSLTAEQKAQKVLASAAKREKKARAAFLAEQALRETTPPGRLLADPSLGGAVEDSSGADEMSEMSHVEAGQENLGEEIIKKRNRSDTGDSDDSQSSLARLVLNEERLLEGLPKQRRYSFPSAISVNQKFITLDQTITQDLATKFLNQARIPGFGATISHMSVLIFDDARFKIQQRILASPDKWKGWFPSLSVSQVPSWFDHVTVLEAATVVHALYGPHAVARGTVGHWLSCWELFE